MKHYNENIIELFVLESKAVHNERNEIEKHLEQCFSCNEVYINIKSFYHKLESTESSQISNQKLIGNKSIVVKPSISRYSQQSSVVPKTIFAKTFYLIRTQPVKSAVSFFGALAIFMLGLNFNKLTGNHQPNNLIKDRNPYIANTNDSTNTLQIYNRENERLFEFPFIHNQKVSYHRTNYNVEYTQVTDLNGDGINEIISILPGLASSRAYSDTIKVFSNEQKLIFKKKIGRSIKYNDKWLEDRFNAFSLIVEDFNNDGTKEIYVGAQSYNSPYVLIKYDNELNEIGEYWHYGWFWGMNKITVNGKMGILLCGLNDVVEGNACPVTSFVDPNKINGIFQSSHSQVFDKMSLIKEENYKTFPRLWISEKIKHKPRINNLIREDKNKIKIMYLFSSVVYNPQYPGLEITLDNNFKVSDVFVGDSFKRVWGITQSNLDKTFSVKK